MTAKRRNAWTTKRDVDVEVFELIQEHQYRRELVMAWWIKQLGATRPSRSITTREIRALLDAQLAAGVTVRTVNLLRAILVDFYKFTGGPTGPNPARAVPKYRVS